MAPFDPASRRLRVDKNVSLRIYCRDQAPGKDDVSLECYYIYIVVAGIPVTEHLEINVVPLAVKLTEKFYQTLQEFFLPRAEADVKESLEPDHSHVFGGVQRKYIYISIYYNGFIFVATYHHNDIDGSSLSRFSSSRRSTMSITSSVTTASSTVSSPPESPSVKEVVM